MLWLWLSLALASDPVGLLQQGRFAEAEEALRVELDSELTRAYRAYHLGNLASALMAQGRAEEAVPAAEQSLALYREELGEDHPSLLTPLLNTAAARLAVGEVESGRAALDEMEQLWVAGGVSPEDQPRYLAQLAQHQLDFGDGEGALARAERALEALVLDQWRASAQRTRAQALQALERTEEAHAQWLALVAHAERVAPGSEAHVEMLLDAARTAPAQTGPALASQAQTLLQALSPPPAMLWGQLGAARAEQGALEEAVAAYSLAVGAAALEERPVLLEAQRDAEQRYVQQLMREGRFGEALAPAEALQVRLAEELGADHPDTLHQHATVAQVLVELDRFEEALAVLVPLEQARDAELRLLGLAERGRVLHMAGRLAEARQVLEEALAISETGEDPSRTATVRGNLALLRYDQGDAVGALEAMRQVEAAVAGQESDLDRSGRLNNLGLVLHHLGDVQGAHDVWWEAIELVIDVHGGAHPYVTRPANHLTNLYAEQYLLHGDESSRDQALELSERVLEARLAQLGPRHSSTAVAYNNRGLALATAGRWPEAREAYLASLEGFAATPEHPQRAAPLANLGMAWLVEDEDRSRALLDEALALRSTQLDRLLDHSSERERLMARDNYEMVLWQRLSVPGTPGEDWALLLRGKGLTARILRAQQQVRGEEDATVHQWHAELVHVRGLLAAAALAGQPLEALNTRKETLERQLASRSAGWRSAAAAAAPTPAAVCEALRPGQVLVDWVLWQRFSRGEAALMRTEESLSAFVVDDACEVRRVDLGPLEPIWGAVSRWRGLLGDPTAPTSRIDAAGERVRERLWAPLEPLVAESRALLLAPGALEAVPWGALPLSDGRYLLERAPIALLSDAGELLRERHPKARGALVVGGVDYEATLGTEGAVSRAAPCGDQPFAPLPATETEAREVARLLGVTPLVGAEATVARVAAQAARSRTVHLATHGFFADAFRCPEIDLGPEARVQWNPLVLSGLALAGANQRAPGDDGIWTAEEVSSLDLRGTELVVLSACETSLGENFGSEGLMGLRRAFSVAGARHLVATLWQVEDQATARVMAALYRQRGRPVAERLRKAQLTELAWQRERFGEARPQAWAAFVAAGPWR